MRRLAARVASALALTVAALPLAGWVPLTTEDANDVPLRWTQGFTIPYHVHTDGYSGLALNRVRAAIDSAFTSWEIPCSSVRSAPDPNGQDADTPAADGQNVMRFEEDALPPEVDPEVVLAFTMHVGVYCTGTIAESDITFNAVTVPWSDRDDPSRADIETVALHEIGHVLGLGHTNYDWAVMYPSIVERVRRDLSSDEEEGICATYGAGLGAECERNADCIGGEVCMMQADSDQSISVRCGERVGAGRPGQRCDAEADMCSAGCANGLCLADGLCSALCRNDADCPNDWTCFRDRLENGQNYGYCVDIALCTDDVDSCPAGQLCSLTEDMSGAGLMRMCAAPTANGRLGDPCGAPDECAAGLCIETGCTQPCDADADCTAPFTCQDYTFGLSSGGEATTGICQIAATPCERNGDCPDGAVCHFQNDGATTSATCATPSGGATGAACQNGRGCESGFCFHQRCSAPCVNDRDCPEAYECGEAPVFSHPTAACLPMDLPPDPDDGTPPPPPADSGPGPDPTTDDAGSTPAGDGGSIALPPGDAGTGPLTPPTDGPSGEGGTGGGPLVGDDAGPVGGGSVVRKSTTESGCTAAPGPRGTTAAWLALAALASALRVARSRRRGAA